MIKTSEMTDVERKGVEAMIDAIKANDLGEVARLESNARIRPDVRDEQGNSLLHLCAQRADHPDQVKITKILLDYGMEPEALDRNGQRPDNIAMDRHIKSAGFENDKEEPVVADRCYEMVCLLESYRQRAVLMEADPSIVLRDQEGRTALHWLAAEGDNDSIGDWIKRGSLTHIEDNNGDTPVCVAAAAGQLDATRTLMDISVAWAIDNNHKNENLLHHAVSGGNLSVIKLALGEPQSRSMRPSRRKILLTQVSDITRATPLQQAIAEKKTGIAIALAEAMVEMEISLDDLQNQAGNTPLEAAAQNGDAEVCRKLLELGCSVRHGAAAVAVMSGDPETVEVIFAAVPPGLGGAELIAYAQEEQQEEGEGEDRGGRWQTIVATIENAEKRWAQEQGNKAPEPAP